MEANRTRRAWVWFVWGVLAGAWALLLVSRPSDSLRLAFPTLAAFWLALFVLTIAVDWSGPPPRSFSWPGGLGAVLVASAGLSLRLAMLIPEAALQYYALAAVLLGMGLGCLLGGLLSRWEGRR